MRPDADDRSPSAPVFEGERVRIGRFRARVSSPTFRDSGPTRGHLVVFPRTTVRIRQAGQAAIVADPTCVVFYNAGQEYTREAISPAGDRCEWFAYRAEDVRDAVGLFDARAEDRADRPFALIHGPSDARAYARQRLLVERAAAGCAIGARAGESEEAALHLLHHLVARAYAARGIAEARRTARARRAHAELAEEARRYLGDRFTEPLSLERIARALDTSPFHLCRVFRRATGHSLHGYVASLRFARALESLPATPDLTALALDLGYASHAHFTTAFRAAVGLTPSEVRRALREASTISKARAPIRS